MDHPIRPRPAAKPRARVAVHVVPAMTDPLGKHFRQPRREAILIGQDTAFMSRATFDKLSEYSTTNPSGVYPGKMWKAERFKSVDGTHEGRPVRRMVPSGVWELRWYGIVPGNDKVCSNNRRVIVLPREKA